MSDTAIRVENLGKRYRIGQREPYKTIRDAISNVASLPIKCLRGRINSDNGDGSEQFWALKNVSFEIKQGEVVGIIGGNGAGKSTLLKILSRITSPTEGLIRLHGRVGSLLEVGTGFHPELTGRENIYLSGSILGMKKREIEDKFEEIVKFAEIDKFIDTPAKRYSSGMYVRLAFAVAAHLDPEILLVDEVLAVGDAGFQRKCLGKMGDVAKEGRTILFVSHNMAAIKNLCSRCILLNHGNIIMDGDSKVIIDQYMNDFRIDAKNQALSERLDRKGSGEILIKEICFYDKNLRPIEAVYCGQECYIGIRYKSRLSDSIADVSIGLSIYSQGAHLFSLSTELIGKEIKCETDGGWVFCKMDCLPLAPGVYNFNIICRLGGGISDWILDAGQIFVNEDDFFKTGRLPPSSHPGVLVRHEWLTEKELHVQKILETI